MSTEIPRGKSKPPATPETPKKVKKAKKSETTGEDNG